MLQYNSIPARELTPEHIAAWDAIQSADPALDSPFLRPEFTQAVAAARPDIEVAVLEDAGRLAGFFPYQRSRRNVGKPVGWKMCDVQGVIARADLPWDASELVRACGLTAWDFHSVAAAQQRFGKFFEQLDQTASMDLSNGFDAYCAARRHAGSVKIKQVQKLTRKAQRETGSVHFELHTDEASVWRQLLKWKSAQYQRTRAVDVVSFPWTVELLERVMAQRGENFGGMLSALYIGDELAAAELGMRWRHVSHAWFTAYNPALSRYSPGAMLTVQIAEAAAGSGITRIDLGKISGMEYKTSFMTDTQTVARGSVTRRPLRRITRRSWNRTRDWLKSSPLRRPASRVANFLRPLRDASAFR